MYGLHRFQLSSLQIISLNSSFFVLIFTFKEEIVSLHPRSVLPKLGACQNQLGNITYFEAQVPPRSIKSEILEVGFWYQLFLKPPGDSIIYIYIPKFKNHFSRSLFFQLNFEGCLYLFLFSIYFPCLLLHAFYLSTFIVLPNGANISFTCCLLQQLYSLPASDYYQMCTRDGLYFSLLFITHFASNLISKFSTLLKHILEVISEPNFLPLI